MFLHLLIAVIWMTKVCFFWQLHLRDLVWCICQNLFSQLLFLRDLGIFLLFWQLRLGWETFALIGLVIIYSNKMLDCFFFQRICLFLDGIVAVFVWQICNYLCDCHLVDTIGFCQLGTIWIRSLVCLNCSYHYMADSLLIYFFI